MASLFRRKESIMLFTKFTKNQTSLLIPFSLKHLLNHQFLNISILEKFQSFSSNSRNFVEYQMPSVTWGVVQGEEDKARSRAMICDYLKSVGIVPDELEELELPSSVGVMRERVEFLQHLGLGVDDINEYPLMLGYSVRKNMIPVLTYLLKLGVPRDRLGKIVRKFPQCLSASVVVELQPIIKSLEGIDVAREHIGHVLMKYPAILGFKIEGTMSTSVAYLVGIGVTKREIGPMVKQYPYLLGMRVGTKIKPMVDYLVSLGLPKMIVVKMLEKRPYILGYNLEEMVKPNVDCLISLGIRREVIPKVIAQYPQILSFPVKDKWSSQQDYFNLKLQIDSDGFALMVENMPQIISLKQSIIQEPVDFFLERGISCEDVAKMIVKCPQLVAVSVSLMKYSFYFFKNVIAKPLKDLVEFPEYFTYSLNLRIKPRYEYLQAKGIQSSLSWFLNCSDRRFEERLFGNYMLVDSVGPSFYMGGKLELTGNVVSEDEDESDQEVLHQHTISL